jgi:hypothetical protein
VIKDCDDFIAGLLAEMDREDDSDSDSGLDCDGGAAGDAVEDLEEVLKGDAPQE